MYNKTIFRFGFCHIRNNPGLIKCDQPQPSWAWLKCEQKKTAKGWGRGPLWVLRYNRLMGMCSWTASHFHYWIEYNRVAFSIELLEWGCPFSEFWGQKVLHIYV